MATAAARDREEARSDHLPGATGRERSAEGGASLGALARCAREALRRERARVIGLVREWEAVEAGAPGEARALVRLLSAQAEYLQAFRVAGRLERACREAFGGPHDGGA